MLGVHQLPTPVFNEPSMSSEGVVKLCGVVMVLVAVL